MRQVIGGKSVYVVEFDTMPELPITGYTDEELAEAVAYRQFLNMANPFHTNVELREKGRTAAALQNAIETGVITEPGKYGIYFVPESDKYEIYKIIE